MRDLAISADVASPSAAHDPRAIANMLLDEADRRGKPLSQLLLHKLLYFTHALHLAEQRRPLVSGGIFEAWKFGPVHTGAYTAFKDAGRRAIRFRGQREDLATGKKLPIPSLSDPIAHAYVGRVMSTFGDMDTATIVALARAKDGPWSYIANRRINRLDFNVKISDIVIQERFRFHKIGIDRDYSEFVPQEDSPLT